MQVVLVYLEWFRRNSLLKYVLQPKIAKKQLTKNPYFRGSRAAGIVSNAVIGAALAPAKPPTHILPQ